VNVILYQSNWLLKQWVNLVLAEGHTTGERSTRLTSTNLRYGTHFHGLWGLQNIMAVQLLVQQQQQHQQQCKNCISKTLTIVLMNKAMHCWFKLHLSFVMELTPTK